MKTLWFFPLAFIANVHGFLIFTPYLMLFLTAAHLSRFRRRRKEMALQPIRVESRPVRLVSDWETS